MAHLGICIVQFDMYRHLLHQKSIAPRIPWRIIIDREKHPIMSQDRISPQKSPNHLDSHELDGQEWDSNKSMPSMMPPPLFGGPSDYGAKHASAAGGEVQQMKVIPPVSIGAIQRKESAEGVEASGGGGNETGLPDNLKSGMEQLSGQSLDDVRVHYNSDQPAQLQAHAYAQGSEIHIAPGQETHLAHEAWHVVQQKQGRVNPTRQLKGKTPVNDDKGLEREADEMGAVAQRMGNSEGKSEQNPKVVAKKATTVSTQLMPVQRVEIKGFATVAKKKKFVDDLIKMHKAKYSDAFIRSCMAELEKIEFESEEHFRQSLAFDLANKSEDRTKLTLQEMYMTQYGWKERAKKDAKVDAKGGNQLKIYRTMDATEWEAIMGGDLDAVTGHMGDFKEAIRYFLGSSHNPKVLVEFPLIAGKEKTLFSKQHLAMPETGKEDKADVMRTALGRENIGKDYSATAGGQGYAVDRSKVGIHSEKIGESGYSLAIGAGGTVSRNFMSLVDRANMGVIGYSDGKNPKFFAKDTKYKPPKPAATAAATAATVATAATAAATATTAAPSTPGTSATATATSATTTATPATAPATPTTSSGAKTTPPKSGTADGKAQPPAAPPAIPAPSANRVPQAALHAYLDRIAVGWNQNHQAAAANGMAGVGGNQGYMANQIAARGAIAMPAALGRKAERKRISAHNLEVRHNGGSQARCFIYSVLMGLTGQSEEDVRPMVNAIAPRAGAAEGWIAADSDIAGNVLAQIHAIYGVQVDLVVVQNGADATIVSGRAGFPNGRTVIIRQDAAHYDAYVPK